MVLMDYANCVLGVASMLFLYHFLVYSITSHSHSHSHSWNIFKLYEPKLEGDRFIWTKADSFDPLTSFDCGQYSVGQGPSESSSRLRKEEELQACDKPPCLKDVKRAMKRLQNKRQKAIGLDRVSNVMILEGGDGLLEALCLLFTIVWLWGLNQRLGARVLFPIFLKGKWQTLTISSLTDPSPRSPALENCMQWSFLTEWSQLWILNCLPCNLDLGRREAPETIFMH